MANEFRKNNICSDHGLLAGRLPDYLTFLEKIVYGNSNRSCRSKDVQLYNLRKNIVLYIAFDRRFIVV
jgi:hypothetical protein